MKKIIKRAVSCLLVIMACVLLFGRFIFDVIIKLIALLRDGYIKMVEWILKSLKISRHDRFVWHDSVFDTFVEGVLTEEQN